MKHLVSFIFFTLPVIFSFSQETEQFWTERFKSLNKEDGHAVAFVATTSTDVIAIYTSMGSGNLNPITSDQVKLIAYDKEKLTRGKTLNLKSSKDRARQKKLKEMRLIKVVSLNDQLHVFWSKSIKNKTEIYAETYSSSFSNVAKLKKIHTFELQKNNHFLTELGKSSLYMTNYSLMLAQDFEFINVQTNNRNGGEIMIGEKNRKSRTLNIYHFAIFDTEYSIKSEGEFDLPEETRDQKNGNYLNQTKVKFGSDGNIYLKLRVKAEENQSQISVKSKNSIVVYDVSLNSKMEYNLDFDQYDVLSFEWIEDSEGLRIYGFYTDKKLTSDLVHGYFTMRIQNNEISNPDFYYFDENIQDSLTVKRNKIDKFLISGHPIEDKSIMIESLSLQDDGSVIIYGSSALNSSQINIQHSGGGASMGGFSGGTTTETVTFSCKKKNLVSFRIDENDKLVWTSILPRQAEFTSSSPLISSYKDLRIVTSDDQAFIIYENDLKEGQGKKRKKRKERRDYFAMAQIDLNTGESKQIVENINPPNTPKKYRKKVDPQGIQVFDNEFYASSVNMRFRPGMTITSLLLFPTIIGTPFSILWMLDGTIMKSEGYFGKIKIADAK